LFAVVHEDGVASAARGGGGEAVFNPRWEMGLASSIAAGIGRAGSDPDVDGALILACDQVVVNAEDLRRLRNAFEPGSLAVAADYGNGAFGVPAIFAREAFAALRALEGDAGAKSFLEEHRGRVRFVPMPSAALDVDRPEDIR
jgi:CTP:molybdopterin cytidylyltransferase MocA